LLHRRGDAEPSPDPAICRPVRGREGVALERHALSAHGARLARQFRRASGRDRNRAARRLWRRHQSMDTALALVLPRDRGPVRSCRRQRMGRQPLPDEGGVRLDPETREAAFGKDHAQTTRRYFFGRRTHIRGGGLLRTLCRFCTRRRTEPQPGHLKFPISYLFLTGSAETSTLAWLQAMQVGGARSPSAMDLARLPDPALAAAFLARREIGPAVRRRLYRGRAAAVASIAFDFRHGVFTRQTPFLKLA